MPILLWLLGVPISLIILMMILWTVRARTHWDNTTTNRRRRWDLVAERYCGCWVCHCRSL